MKNPFGIFVLTKREQRVVIVIMTVLLAATIAKRYRENRWHIATPAPTTPQATPADEHAVAPNESP